MDKNSNTKKLIIIGEDDPAYSNVYEFKLKSEGYDVIIASNGEEVLKVLQDHKADLILLDLVMPVKDGFSTLQEIKAKPEYKDIKVIVASNLGQEEDITKAQALGANDYIVKANVSISQLIDKLKQHLG